MTLMNKADQAKCIGSCQERGFCEGEWSQNEGKGRAEYKIKGTCLVPTIISIEPPAS